MATIAVIGANGRTGRLIVDRALAAGHTVTAISRRPDPPAHPRLRVHIADVLHPAGLQAALSGQDAVVSALGATGRGPTAIYSAGTRAVIAAMGGTRRLLVLSSAGLGVPIGAGLGTRLAARILQRIMRETYADMARMEDLLARHDLDWTVVRPTQLVDGPATGRIRTSIGGREPVGRRISRADLAGYVLDALDDPAIFRTAVAVSS